MQKGREDATGPFEVAKSPAFSDLAIFEHDNLIDIAQRTQAVRDHNHCASNDQMIERAHHFRLGLYIQGRRRLVEDQNRSIAQNGAGDGNALALATGEILALLAYQALVAAQIVENRKMDISL